MTNSTENRIAFETFCADHKLRLLWTQRQPRPSDRNNHRAEFCCYHWPDGKTVLFVLVDEHGWEIYLPATASNSIPDTYSAMANWLARAEGNGSS